jgi:hypothetical protein
MKHTITINSKSVIRIFVAMIILYLLYTMSYAPSTSIMTMPIVSEDSPYVTPEGWPLPYPYVAPPSN